MKTKTSSPLWYLRRLLSDVPSSLEPQTKSIVEKIAVDSLKYDHLGGPNTNHVIFTLFKKNQLKNPNNAWDVSKNAAPIMKRVFKLENLLDFTTTILQFLVLLPMILSFFMLRKSNSNFLRTLRRLQSRYRNNTPITL
eukprot:gb/GECH01011217.1/.p1 GENE.gb/GECH01011217.1/~~gb/GECH01011217.1/.p1  ORF type:complete len:138 (+),score=22.86 gb/GECH01011217.1/:1-414(+)